MRSSRHRSGGPQERRQGTGQSSAPLNTGLLPLPLQAQASAKIVGLANAGGDTTNSIKQAAEFGT